MIKYKNYMIVFEEIPDKVTLAVNITNCQNRCVGCHSPELREDIGNELTKEEVDKMIEGNYGINCFLFMGEGNDIGNLCNFSKYIKEKHGLLTALYSASQGLNNTWLIISIMLRLGHIWKNSAR